MDAILSPDSQSNPSTYNNSNEDSTIIDNISSDNILPAVRKVSESDIVEVDYTYLVDNPEKYSNQDKYLRVAGCISEISLCRIVLKSDNGDKLNIYTQSACDLSGCYEGMYVTLIGKLGEYDTISLVSGYIEQQGDDAENTYKRLTVEGDKLRAADKKAEEEEAKKAKKDYIAACKTYKYKDIARNPNNYEGKKAKFTGKVIQVQEGTLETVLLVDVTKDKYGYYDDTMYVTYFPSSDYESRILEDDIITIYGELAGIKTYETVLGASVSIPQIDAKYIVINS